MTETPFTPPAAEPDISAYENIDLSKLNEVAAETPPTEQKLEQFLVKAVFVSRIAAWVGIVMMLLVGLYGWTRSQTQNSWLINLPISTAGSPLCTWMNRWLTSWLRKDTRFIDYLTAQGKNDLVTYIDNNRCIGLDTIMAWLDTQKTFATEELKKSYEKIIPKKFLSTTIAASPELDVIAALAPTNRMRHEEVINVLSDTTEKFSDTTTRIVCDEIRFEDLSATAQCQITTRFPTQSRTKALDFVKALSDVWTLLVTYPNMLDMAIDEKTNLLTTEIQVQMTYIPARYEAEQIKKLTYEKR
jgi:hypothetical protein